MVFSPLPTISFTLQVLIPSLTPQILFLCNPTAKESSRLDKYIHISSSCSILPTLIVSSVCISGHSFLNIIYAYSKCFVYLCLFMILPQSAIENYSLVVSPHSGICINCAQLSTICDRFARVLSPT